MKKYLVIFAFIFIANFVFADCFIDNPASFLTLENEKLREILCLTQDEISDSEVYQEVFSSFKDRFSIDIEKDIKQITLYFNAHILVVNGNFNTEIIQNRIQNLSEAEKWPNHQITDFKLGDNKYNALRLNMDNNIVFYDKNTLVFCRNSAENDDSIKITESLDFINNKNLNNYLYVGKGMISLFNKLCKNFDLGLEKANYLICYINDKQLSIEADFNDSSISKKLADKINKLLTKEQIEKLNKSTGAMLENSHKSIYRLKKDLPELLFNLSEAVYSADIDFFSDLKCFQSGNRVVFTCDFNKILAIQTNLTNPVLLIDIKQAMKSIRKKCGDSSKLGINNSETFKTLYVENLQKGIDDLKGKINKSNFADCLRYSAILYIDSKAKKFIDSIINSSGENGDAALLKTKFDLSYLAKSIRYIWFSIQMNTEKNVNKYMDYLTTVDKGEWVLETPKNAGRAGKDGL